MERTSMRLEDLVLNPNNCRTHSKRQTAQLKASICEFGFLNPLLVDEHRRVIAGHARWAAAKQLGLEEAPVIVLNGLSEARKRALALADNKIPANAGWDLERLAVELATLPELLVADGIDISITGFEPAEIDQLLVDFNDHAADAIDDFDATEQSLCSISGDVWLLGNHRLMCGNARSDAHLDRLMAGDAADMCFTDPPYNVRISQVVGRGQVKHREFAEASGEKTAAEFIAFLKETLGNAKRISRAGAVHYVCMDWRHVGELLDAASEIYVEHLNTAIWVKSNAGQGSFYRSQHEQVLIFRVGGAVHSNNVQLGKFGRNRSNVWAYPGMNSFRKGRLEELGLHPTMKPTKLVADAIKDATARGDIVVDPFSGSGTTILAAEIVGRKAYALELSARYVDVAVHRWQAFTKRDAVNESTGATFDETRESRDPKAIDKARR